MNGHSNDRPQDVVAVDKPVDKLCHCCRTALPDTAITLLCPPCMVGTNKSKTGQLVRCSVHGYEYDPSAVTA